MSDKNMDEKLIKKPIVKVVKRNGSLHEEIVEKPKNESADELYNILLHNVDPDDTSEGMTGLAKNKLNISSADLPKKSINVGDDDTPTGFAQKEHLFSKSSKQDEDPSIIDAAILNSYQNAHSHYKDTIKLKIVEIEGKYDKLSFNWWMNKNILSAVTKTIAKDINLPEYNVSEIIIDIKKGK